MRRMIAVMAGFSGGAQGVVFDFERWIEADGDEGGHVDCLSQDCPAALTVGFSTPSAGLPGDRGEACEAGGLFGVHAAQFRHVDQQYESSDLAQTGDADEGDEVV